MSILRILAIGFIFACTTIAWMILGAANLQRTDSSFESLKGEVRSLYGSHVLINAPECKLTELVKDPSNPAQNVYINHFYDPSKTNAQVDIKLDQRKKGVLWFPTFKASFVGNYVFAISDFDPSKNYYIFTTLQSKESLYDNIGLEINGRRLENIMPLVKKENIPVVPGKDGLVTVNISYDFTGMDTLTYQISSGGELSQINDFTLTINTDFNDYDFSQGTISPTTKTDNPGGSQLVWRLNSSVTGKNIGLVIPNKLNPGEIVSRVTFFAPVPLLFFFVVMMVIALMTKTNLHPMHYFFLAATFFSFHLMYSYFSDHLDIYLTFAIASTVSLALTVSYLKWFVPARIAFMYAPAIQIVYLVAFSYSFFFKGMTGLIVTICSVLTLFILMQATGKVNWDEVFKGKQPEPQPWRKPITVKEVPPGDGK